MNINSVHGGQPEQAADYTGLPAHCVPDSCRIIIDRRFLMEEPIEAVRQEVIDLLDDLKARRENFDYDIREINRVIPSMTDRDAPIVTTVHNAIRDVLGQDPSYVASPGSYDQKHIDRIGTLKNCIAYGPGILELAHKPDEWIGITDMLDSAKIMARSLEALLLS